MHAFHGVTTMGRYRCNGNVRNGLSAIEVAIMLIVMAVLLVLSWPTFNQWRSRMLDQNLVEALEQSDRGGALRALRRGASPDAWSGSTPHYCLRCQAVVQNDLEMACLVFPPTDAGHRFVPKHNPPLLNVAVAMRSVEMASLLLEGGGDINGRVRYGFHKRMASGSPGKAFVEIAKLLDVHEQANVSVYKHILMTPYIIPEAEFIAAESVTEYPESARTRENMAMNTLLHDAVILDDAAMLRLLLEHGADPGLTNEAGKTALQLAEALDRKNLVAVLKTARGVAGQDVWDRSEDQ